MNRASTKYRTGLSLRFLPLLILCAIMFMMAFTSPATASLFENRTGLFLNSDTGFAGVEGGLNTELNRVYDLFNYDFAPGSLVASKSVTSFADDAKLLGHFEKHGAEFGAKTADEYLKVGHDIMEQGTKVNYLYKGETRTGFVQFMGNTSKGNAKFGFVGTNAEGQITTIHVESGKSFWKMLNGTPEKVINGVQ